MVVFSIMGSRASWNCGENSGYNFRVTSSGSVQVENHSDDNEPAQEADIFINGELIIDDADVPAMNAGTDWTEFAHIYPPSDNWEWRVKGETDCGDSGEHHSPTPPPPTSTEVPTATPDPEPSATPDPEPTEKPTHTPDPEPSATDDDDDDDDPTPKPTRTKEPEDTETPEPTRTRKPTRTPDPEPTETSRPDPTDIPKPDPTDTSKPDPTDTPKPQPEPSDTPIPAPTNTQKPRPQPSATLLPLISVSTATPPLTGATPQQNFCSACSCPCACSCGAGASQQTIVVEVVSEATNFDSFAEPAKVLVVGLVFFMAGGLGVMAFATYVFGGLGPRR